MPQRLIMTERASPIPLYLSHMDMIVRYTWVGLCLGFSYNVDPSRLQEALRELLQSYSSLAGRYYPPPC